MSQKDFYFETFVENSYIQLIPYFLKGKDVFKNDKFCYITREKVVAKK